MILRFRFPLLAATFATASVQAQVGFGSRDQGSAPSTPAPAPIAKAETASPPVSKDVEWLRVPFDKAENELLKLFQKDLPEVAKQSSEFVLYDIRVTGNISPAYAAEFKRKLETTLLSSGKIRLKDCPQCDESRVVRTESGEVRYESRSSDPARPARIAHETGVDHLLSAELEYTPEEVKLRLRLVQASTGTLAWTAGYSTADVIQTRESLADGEARIGKGESLSHVLIGEIAFTTVVSPGVSFLPGYSPSGQATRTAYPSLDILIGEKFDRGHKRFGFLIGTSLTLGEKQNPMSDTTHIPWFLRFAPQFRYTFNPYAAKNARYSIVSEVGGLISLGYSSAYLALGAEAQMINRFSVSVIPAYVMKASLKSSTQLYEQPDGSWNSSGQRELAKIGGLALFVRGNINW